ncbi:carboxylesterase/lipase family protein [Rathayibacter sp. SD072]|uniref:carboxylesterase/lipase family protein n=1 Tax=Rathayibacter sp. SD072 TaxID=2781731 RepID=UPI001A977B04|nr:carboxylesterase family protein [Rathayibacter sp. SD072]MBO0983511.1 carboxylesterase family protein [Rathayibacter sp. SD072]
MPERDTPAGRIRGLTARTPDGDAHAFLGVPFARATRRFRPAASVARWDGVRTATRIGPSAPQSAQGSGAPLGDEDACLTLNIWAPSRRDGAAPVLVWIHGGLHVAGSNSDPLCDGARLATRTGIVVVAVNHRLGALGFLTLDHLLGDEYRDSGNAALHDVIAALEWVRENIGAFGGDPAAVTLAGQSAGATTVAMLLAADAAAGLFHRAILHSADPERIGDRDYGEAVTDDLLGLLDLHAAPRRLLDLPVPLILEAQNRLLAQRSSRSPTTVAVFRAALDGRLLTRPPVAALRQGASTNVDLIVGTNVNEASGAVDLEAGDDEAWRRRLDERLQALLPRLQGDRSSAYRDALALVLGRPPSDAEALEACLADEIYRQPSHRLLDARAGAEASTRAFLFAHRVDDARGAAHSLELPFLFRNLDRADAALLEEEDGDALALSDAITDRWAAFIAGRAPDGWPEYSAARRSTLVLAHPPVVESAPREAVRRLVAQARP